MTRKTNTELANILRRDRANHSLNDRAAQSTASRKVKITLPRVSCLEQPADDVK